MLLAFALFADSANVSVEGKLNILGVFDALQVGNVPTVHPRATLVMRLKGTLDETGNHRVALTWTSPSGEELWTSSGELEIGSPPVGAVEMDFPLILTFDLPIPMAGTHRLKIVIDDQLQEELAVHTRIGGVPMAAPAIGGILS